jgi:hypothetical protein
VSNDADEKSVVVFEAIEAVLDRLGHRPVDRVARFGTIQDEHRHRPVPLEAQHRGTLLPPWGTVTGRVRSAVASDVCPTSPQAWT